MTPANPSDQPQDERRVTRSFADVESLPPARGGDTEVEGEAERLRVAYERTRADGVLRYSWFNPGQQFMMQDLERRVLDTLRRLGCQSLADLLILEIGCASGTWLRQLLKWGAQPEHVFGTDLLAERIAMARRLSPPGVHLSTGNAAALPFPDDSFDMVCQSTVFTSILDPALRRRVADQLVRVVRPDGFIVWYDFHVNNPRNRDVRGVDRGEIRDLFRGCSIQLQRTTLAPPLSRALAPRSWLACWLLAKLPPLCTHYLGIIRKA